MTYLAPTMTIKDSKELRTIFSPGGRMAILHVRPAALRLRSAQHGDCHGFKHASSLPKVVSWPAANTEIASTACHVLFDALNRCCQELLAA